MQAGLQNAINVSIPAGFQQIEAKRQELTTGLYEVAAGYGQVRYGWEELDKAVARLIAQGISREEIMKRIGGNEHA